MDPVNRGRSPSASRSSNIRHSHSPSPSPRVSSGTNNRPASASISQSSPSPTQHPTTATINPPPLLWVHSTGHSTSAQHRIRSRSIIPLRRPPFSQTRTWRKAPLPHSSTKIATFSSLAAWRTVLASAEASTAHCSLPKPSLNS